jgi:hypothetical protein
MSPCEWLKGPNGEIIHIKRARLRGRKHCKFCDRDYRSEDGKMCDFPVASGKTCDAEMCGGCACTLGRQTTDIGHGMKKLNDSIDVCPIHRSQAVVRDGKLVFDGTP